MINGVTADIPVGFIPGGGTSVLPRALGLPRDPSRAAERIASGKPRRISLGRINGRRFAFNCGIGFDAELVRRVDALGRREDGLAELQRDQLQRNAVLLSEIGHRLAKTGRGDRVEVEVDCQAQIG